MKQFFTTSISAVSLLIALHPLGANGGEIRREAKSFDRCLVADPLKIEAIKTANNLVKGGNGWFDYDIDIKDGGWYELLIEPSAAGHEVFIDGGEYTYSGTKKAGNHYLCPGKHSIRIQGLHHSGLREMTSFTLRPSEDKLAKRIRIESPGYRDFFAVGEKIRLQVTHGATALDSVLNVRVTDSAGEPVVQTEVKLPADTKLKVTPVEVIVKKEGTMTASFFNGSEPLTPQDCPPLLFDVIDDTTPAAKEEAKKKLVFEVDCADKAPDYTGGRELSRVITKPFGRYRESGNVGWLQNFNDKDPSWFAYAVTLPEPQRLYLVEVDYPDDAVRTFCISLKSDASSSYPITGGVDSGGEFRLTNSMKTQSLYLWARSTNLRVVMIVPNSGYRAAASKIRIYQIDGNPQPALRNVSGGRNLVNWFEEGASMFGMFAAPHFKKYNDWKPQDAVISTDRFCQLLSSMGGDSLIYTMAIYQFGMYPSRYNVSHNGLYTTDIVGRMILKCQKYGVRFYGEFHPEARELAWYADSANPYDPTFALNVKGKKRVASTDPIYNPLLPRNREWYLGMLGEFADRYAQFPGFQGVSLRIMTWCNPGLNNFQNLDWGYDDYCVSLFQKETGIAVPGKDNDPERFYERYLFLTGPQRERWIRWRCEKITDLHKRIVERVKKARPDLEVCLNIFGLAPEELPPAGLDTKALDTAGVRVINSTCNYGRHPHNNVQDIRDRMLDPVRIKSMDGGTSTPSYLYSGQYFEATELVLTPVTLGFPANTPTGWISGVVNPSGDSFLERYALTMAEADAGMLGDGGNTYTLGQPMLREFAREFRVLPNRRFSPRPDARDPVAVWELKGPVEFYF
ncbi:MAG: family 10 glycosylhydrolase, partial [Victivallales bacterium]